MPGRVVHSLKCWPVYFEAIGAGRKTFEARKDDRGFRVGDMLHLHEFNPATEKQTGRHILCLITYKLDGPQFGIERGNCILALRLPSNHSWPIKPLRVLRDRRAKSR
jgi:hypothetical protein